MVEAAFAGVMDEGARVGLVLEKAGAGATVEGTGGAVAVMCWLSQKISSSGSKELLLRRRM